MGMMPSYPPGFPPGVASPHNDPIELAALPQRRAVFRLVFVVGIVLGAIWMISASCVGWSMMKQAEESSQNREREAQYGYPKRYFQQSERYDAERYENGVEPALQLFLALAGLAGIVGASMGLAGKSAGRTLFLIAFIVLAVCHGVAYCVELSWQYRQVNAYQITLRFGWTGWGFSRFGYLLVTETFPAIAIATLLTTRWTAPKSHRT